MVLKAFYNEICKDHGVLPGDACIHFSLSHPAIVSMALNTSKPEKMNRNVEILKREVPDAFWGEMKGEGLIDPDYKYV